MTIKLGKVVAYHEELPLMKLLDPSVILFCKVTLHIKYFIFSLATCTRPRATKHGLWSKELSGW